MKKNTLELVFILDRSGSMNGLEADTIGGYNALINKQKAIDGEVFVSTVLFNTETKVLHDRKPIADVAPLDISDYEVGGCTALLDAIGGAIHHIENIHKYAREEDVPEHTMFVITTDGMENASHSYDYTAVKRMIEQKKESKGWEFLFLAANIDVAETASNIGIGADRAVNYRADSQGTQTIYAAVEDTVTQFRTKGAIHPLWSKPIEDDYKRRNEQKRVPLYRKLFRKKEG